MHVYSLEREKREGGKGHCILDCYICQITVNCLVTILFFSPSCLAVAPIACSGTELDCATALCELQAADTLAGVVGYGGYIHEHEHLALLPQAVLEQKGELAVPVGYVLLTRAQGTDNVAQTAQALVDMLGLA